MKFSLEFSINLDSGSFDSSSVLNQLNQPESQALRHAIMHAVETVEGRMIIYLAGKDAQCEHQDPILRLISLWLRKLPWVIGGDTETVALRNSEHCFAFVPAGESVEVSYFTGSESEVEEYILEPVTIRLDTFVTESVRMGERLVEVLKLADADLFEQHEDCKDLQLVLTEAKRAFRDYQLHQRR